jgi:FkbM family methyltransferase
VRRFPDPVELLERLVRRLSHRPPEQGGLERHGTAYGGWTIPCGLLGPDSIVYSGGLGEDASFDLSVIHGYGCTVWAFDPTPRAADYAATIQEGRFVFVPVGVWSEDSTQQFHAPPREEWVSHSIVNPHGTAPSFAARCRSVSSLMAELGHNRIDLLKLDIEGAEYEVLRSLLAGTVRPAVVCVELHRVEHLRRARVLLALRRAGYALIAVDGWNLTFLLSEPRPTAGRS